MQINRILLSLFILIPISFLKSQNAYEEIQIPMRDDKSLVADLYLPNPSDTFPVVLIQTPYNKAFYRTRGLPLGVDQDLANSPYAFVVLDWRCRFASIGACSAGSNNGEDGYDAVEWIAEQPWCNGKIGTLGPSALGNIQYQTAREQPPHLVCAIPEVASPQFHYQQYLPGGALRTEYFQSLGILFPGSGFNLIVANPHYNLLWRITENETMYPQDVAIPMLLIGGWFDHNIRDNFTMIDTLASSSDPAVRGDHKILVGPWVHGGTGLSFLGSAIQGELRFPDAEGWNIQMSRQFMDYYLLEMDNGWNEHQRYIYYQMGDGEILESNQWPPPNITDQKLYLHHDGLLDPSVTAQSGSSEFRYDPQDPSPTVGGKTLSLALNQGPYDQKLIESRDDHLIFSTGELTSGLVVKGSIKVNLFISSDRKDTDIVLRLTDVYPDRRSMLLGESTLRMRFRNGYTIGDTSFMSAGEVYPISLAFEDLAHTFLPGHKLRLIITSSNYPRYNRNMNTGGEMYPNNQVDTLVDPLIATNKIWMGPDYPSVIILPSKSPIQTNSDKIEKNQFLEIFPNPTTNRLFLDSERRWVRASIIDQFGILRISVDKADIQNLDVSQLPNGIYWLKLHDISGIRTNKKFVVIR